MNRHVIISWVVVFFGVSVLMLSPALLTAQATANKPPEKPLVVDKGTYRVSPPPGGGWKVESEKETGGLIFRKTKAGLLAELAMQERKFEIRIRERSLEIEEWQMTEDEAVAMIMDRIEANNRTQGISSEKGVTEMEGKKLHYLTFKAAVTGDKPNAYSYSGDYVGDVYSNFKLNGYYFYYFPPDFKKTHRLFELLYGSYLSTDFFRLYKNPGQEPIRAVFGSLEIVDPLQAVPDPDGELLRAAAAGNVEAVRQAIEKGAKADAAAPQMTALSAAALYGHRDIVDLLLGQGADVNKADEEGGYIPLHQALIGGEPEIAEILVGRGADVNLRTKTGFSALMYAIGTGSSGLAMMLIERGADVNAKTNDGETALIFAADSGSKEILQLLMEKGADMNTQAKSGSTALMHAVVKKNADVARSLLESGAEVNLKSEKGGTALIAAVYSGDLDIARALMEKGADVNAKMDDGQTALMKASEEGQAEIVKLLIERGADVNAKNEKKQTALKFAKKNKKAKIVKLLQAAGAKG